MNPTSHQKPVVAIVVDTLSRGGAEKVALGIANHLDARRYKPILITTRTPGEMIGELKEDVERFSLNRRKRFDLSAVIKLARFLDERNAAIVHSHNHSTSYFCRVARLFCKNRWKHVVHDHHGPIVGSWKAGILDRIFLNNVDAYIGVSATLARRAHTVIGLPENQCIHLPNGIAMPEQIAQPRNDVPVIVQVGRIEPVKNQMMAIGIADELRERGLRFQWQFIGKANDREYHRQLLEAVKQKKLHDSIVFLGERADVSDLLRSADIGILTSTHEGLSIALLEYMAHSLPVVITEVGESADIIRASGGGFVIPQQGKIQAAGKITELIKNESLRRAQGKNSRSYAEHFYSIDFMMKKMMDIYEMVAGHA